MCCGDCVPGKFGGAVSIRSKAGSMKRVVVMLLATASCAGEAAGEVGAMATPAGTGQAAQDERPGRQAAGQGGYCDPLAVNGVAPDCRTRSGPTAVGRMRNDANPGAFLLLLQILRSPK